MYNSGDQARFLEDGNIMFGGRNDDQVKISGQRLELGSVEAAMLSCVGVKGSVAMMKTVNENKMLIGFVACSEADENEEVKLKFKREMKIELKKKLAKHEVPHRLILINEIPLSTAGKANKKELKNMMEEIEEERVQVFEGVGKQGSTVSRVVKDCFEEVLGGKVERESDFFQEGGTSLMLMKLSGRIQEIFGISIGISF